MADLVIAHGKPELLLGGVHRQMGQGELVEGVQVLEGKDSVPSGDC